MSEEVLVEKIENINSKLDKIYQGTTDHEERIRQLESGAHRIERIDQKIDYIRKRIDEEMEDVENHEERLRDLEEFKNRAEGIKSLAAVLVVGLSSGVASLLTWFLSRLHLH